MNWIEIKLRKLINDAAKEVALLKKEYDTLPKGELHRHKKGNKTYYSVKNGKKITYISKNKNLITLYERKKEIKLLLRSLDDDIFELQKCIRKLSSNHDLSPLEMMWLLEPYESNPNKTEFLVYVTNRGEKVRSKSEKIIADILHKHKISYKYEAPFILNGKTIYPDFTILRKDGKLILWEHFGLMTNESYHYSAIRKIISYASAGYYTNNNLICTYEENITSPAELADIITRFII